jgi:hypothetical protein
MSIPIPDLWPEELGNTSDIAPIAILKTQASLLGQKTRGLVTGKIQKFRFEDEDNDDRSRMLHSFSLVAPAIGNYRVDLFYMESHLEELYPITIVVYPRSTEALTIKHKIETESALHEILKKIFSASETLKVIRSIVAHSTANAPQEKAPDADVPF